MDIIQIVQTLMALLFVLGLLFITLWLIKICQQKGLNCRLGKSLAAPKIKILEQRRIDIKNTLALVQYRDQEILLLLGTNNVMVIDHQPVDSSSKGANHA